MNRRDTDHLIFQATPPNIVHPQDDTPIDFGQLTTTVCDTRYADPPNDVDGLSQFVLNRQGLSLDLSGGNDRTCKEQIQLCAQQS